MIIWSGIGWIVAVVAFCCLMAAEYLTEAMTGDESYYQAHGWPKLAGFMAAALILFPVARFRSGMRDRHLVDKETGQEVVMRANDSLFFIPLRHWPYLAVALGVVFLFVTE